MNKILETKRLYLRDFTGEDVSPLAAMFSDPDVMKYIGTGIVLTEEHAKRSVKNWPEYGEKHGFTNWAVVRKEDELMIGKCGFNWLPDNIDIEIAYMFDKPYWRKGYATEMAQATLDHGFSVLKLSRIAALVYPENTASEKVLEKIGMKYEKNAEFWGILLKMYTKSLQP